MKQVARIAANVAFMYLRAAYAFNQVGAVNDRRDAILFAIACAAVWLVIDAWFYVVRGEGL